MMMMVVDIFRKLETNRANNMYVAPGTSLYPIYALETR
jgi:hypothetical protein